MATCPICQTTLVPADPALGLPEHPYMQCPGCGLLRQPSLPAKTYEGPEEGRGDEMSNRDREINRTLAGWLLTWMPVDKGQNVLDVGAKYPYLLHCMKAQRPSLDPLAIDGIPEVIGFGESLGVPAAVVDIERGPFPGSFIDRRWNLINLVHLIEHMYAPVDTLKRLASQLSPEGAIFVRCPTYDVEGIERHMSPHHYTIHVSVFCRTAIWELAKRCGLVVVYEMPIKGGGQTDFVLRKQDIFKQTIGVGLIVKNEERDLPAALDSAAPFADVMCIIDTGSTDGTRDAVWQFCMRHGWNMQDLYRPEDITVLPKNRKTVLFGTFLGASTKDDTGDWKLNSFSEARNEYVAILDRLVDWIFWLDADDIILSPEKVRGLIGAPSDAFNFDIVDREKDHTTAFAHLRLWRAGRGTRYKGACHEYPYLGDGMRILPSGINILHRWDPPTTGEVSETRNLRILRREYESGVRDSRTLFYYANTLRDCQKWDEAISVYREYLDRNEGWHDEKVFAHLYLARCYRFSGNSKEALKTVYQGLALDERFSELWMEGACLYYALKSPKTVAMCIAALQPLPDSSLFVEGNKYRDQPWRILASWYESIGQKESAANAYRQVLAIVPGDRDMEVALERVSPSPKPVPAEEHGTIETILAALPNARPERPAASERPEIHLLRPGAAGDVLCILQCLPALRKAHPDSEIILHTHPSFKGLAMLSPDLDLVYSHDMYPRDTVSLIGYPLKDGWPNCTMSKHLKDYFADELGVPAPKEPVTLKVPSNPMWKAKYVTLHPKAGWSPYKEWPFDRWATIVDWLSREGIKVVQIGGDGDSSIPGATQMRHLSFPESLAVIKGARFHMGIDSWSNHACGGVAPITPAIILFGSTSPQEFGYPQSINIHRPAFACHPCHREYPGMTRHPLPPCPHVWSKMAERHGSPANIPANACWTNENHPCMGDIAVGEVWLHVRSMIDKHWG